MEDDDTPEDTRRVRILSTLESTRQTSRPGRSKGKRRGATSKRRGLLQTALWGFMGVGVLALMAGFVMVIQDGKTGSGQTALVPITQQAKADVPKAASLSPVADAGPAVIETSALSAASMASPAASAAASAALATLAPVASAKVETGLTSNKSGAPPHVDKNVPAAPPLSKSVGKPQDEDVALLEAMFAHTGRKTPSRPANPKN